jgi:hypothetical protein
VLGFKGFTFFVVVANKHFFIKICNLAFESNIRACQGIIASNHDTFDTGLL